MTHSSRSFQYENPRFKGFYCLMYHPRVVNLSISLLSIYFQISKSLPPLYDDQSIQFLAESISREDNSGLNVNSSLWVAMICVSRNVSIEDRYPYSVS